jgi:hypothetical protein
MPSAATTLGLGRRERCGETHDFEFLLAPAAIGSPETDDRRVPSCHEPSRRRCRLVGPRFCGLRPGNVRGRMWTARPEEGRARRNLVGGGRSLRLLPGRLMSLLKRSPTGWDRSAGQEGFKRGAVDATSSWLRPARALPANWQCSSSRSWVLCVDPCEDHDVSLTNVPLASPQPPIEHRGCVFSHIA